MNLFVSNLNPDTTEAALEKLFGQFGEVVSVKIVRDAQTGASRRFGFVTMAEKFDAYDAIDNIDMIYFEGDIIKVSKAKKDTRSGGGPKKPSGNRYGRPRGMESSRRDS